MRRSERLSLALTSRGFNPSRIPEVVTAQRFGVLDWLILATIVIGWIAWFFLRF
jgi:energy-coupling factor transporter transmembrane protein EcfT